MDAKDAGPQAIGSAITYGRRYALSSFAGIAPEDDDGNAATHSEPPKKQAKPEPVKAPPKQAKELNWSQAVSLAKQELFVATGNHTAFMKIVGEFGYEDPEKVTDRNIQVDMYKAWNQAAHDAKCKGAA
jgi:hypothetical protein